MSWKIFSGIEAEGPYIGKKTLFVEGLAPFSELSQIMVETLPTCIYFGARYKKFREPSSINYEQVDRLISKNYRVVVEGTIRDCNLIYFLNSEEFKKAQLCVVFLNIDSLDEILALLSVTWPKDRVWIKLTNPQKKITLFPMDVLQIPDTTLYEKDELLAESD